MKTAKVRIIISLVVLSAVVLLLWVEFRPVPPTSKTKAQQDMALFHRKMDADSAWYREADARGVSSKKYLPLELAATDQTATERNLATRRPGWASLSASERAGVTDRIDRQSDAARQAMRNSNYKKPFRPNWQEK